MPDAKERIDRSGVAATRRAVVSLLALALLATACASDDSQTTQRAGAGGPGGTVATTAPSPGSSDADATEDQLEAPAADGESAGPAPPVASDAPSVAAEERGGPPPAVERMGTGVTERTVKVGVMIPANVAAAASAFGLKDFSTGDNQRQAQAVVDHLNATGGIAGRRIEPVYFENDLNNGTYSSQAEAMCASWTLDHKVFAGIGGAADIATHADCMARRRTPLIATPNISGMGFLDEKTLQRHRGYLYWPNMIYSRYLRVNIDRLVARGFWDGKNRIGLLRFDSDIYKRVADEVVKPGLAAHGLKLVEEVAVKSNGSLAEAGGPSSEISNSVLRFKSKDVDRMIVLESSAGPAMIFMSAAEGQRYRPRYALTSIDMPNFLESNVPKDQLVGAAGIGWMPTFDVGFAKDPGTAPSRDLCMRIMKEAGETFPDRSAQNYALSYCEAFFLLKAGLEGAGGDLTTEGFEAAIDSLGDSLPSILTFGTRWAPNRHAAVSAYRDFAFDGACGCFAYAGGVGRFE